MLGETKLVSVGTLKVGSYVVVDGVACKVVDLKVSRPGKHGHAKVNMMAVGVLDDKKRNAVMPGHDNVPVPIIGKHTAQVLSVSDNMANVMDESSFETFDLEIPEDMEGQVAEGNIVVYWQVLEDRVMKQVKE